MDIKTHRLNRLTKVMKYWLLLKITDEAKVLLKILDFLIFCKINMLCNQLLHSISVFTRMKS